MVNNHNSLFTNVLRLYYYKTLYCCCTFNSFVLQFFPDAEGYVKPNGTNTYLYVYQYKDHLGNIRLTYRDGFKNHATQENPKDGIIQVSEIIEKSDYYPFGLKQGGNDLPDYSSINKYKYAYGGKELNDELGLDLYDFGARNYDPALGRWLNVDPLAENSRRWTPYNYAYNNPIYFVDPDGMQSRPMDGYGRDLLNAGVAFDTMFQSDSGQNESMESDKVIITGPGAQQATQELNKSTNLKITRDNETGELSASGKAKNAYDEALQSSINNQNITVHLKTVDTEVITLQDGTKGDIAGGTYGGSIRNGDGTVDAFQYINMDHFNKIEKAGMTKQGNLVGHELNESFFAAQYNNGNNPLNLGVNSNAAYKTGHGKAMKVDRIQEPELKITKGVKYLIYPTVEVKLN